VTTRATRLELDSDEYLIVSYERGPLPEHSALSPAERDVAVMLLLGLSYREIAIRRGRSERTVAKQIAAAFKKLGVTSRAELAVLVGRSVR
jgi:DNA-binding CsgD family transcriptional regulator